MADQIAAEPYTPTTETIRQWVMDDGGLAEYHDPINGHLESKRAGQLFDRWLAEHDRAKDAEIAALTGRIEKAHHLADAISLNAKVNYAEDNFGAGERSAADEIDAVLTSSKPTTEKEPSNGEV